MAVKKIPARGAMVEVTITFTEEEYEKVQHRALWDYGSVESMLKAMALGNVRRGC